MEAWKRFRLSVEDGIACVVFDDQTAPVNTLSIPTIEEMKQLLELIKDMAAEGEIQGLALVSGKPGNFLSGKDMSDDGPEQSREELVEGLMNNHRLFTGIASLPVPTVVGIDGYCLGGGFEFALSFGLRIARESPRTRFGFPEIGLGIFPGSGGTQRFPRLVGPEAVEIVMSGRQLTAQDALALGAVDRVVPADADLMEACKQLAMEAASGAFIPRRPTLDLEALDAAVDRQTEAIRAKRNGRLLPGENGALRAMKEGTRLPVWDGLVLEANLFADINDCNEAKGSMHTFGLRQAFGRPKTRAIYGETLERLAKELSRGGGDMAATGRRLLDEGVVEDPRLIDAAAVLDLGYAPETGGPLMWSDLIGESEKRFGKNFYGK